MKKKKKHYEKRGKKENQEKFLHESNNFFINKSPFLKHNFHIQKKEIDPCNAL